MKLNTYELYGIGAVILLMAGGVWLTNFNNSIVGGAPSSTQAAVVVSPDGDQSAALANAILEAGGGDDKLEQMIVDDVRLGIGDEVNKGDTVTVHYIGTLPNGQEFDSSRKRGEPFTFTVGDGKVITGWDEGLLGMRAQGQRILVIPPHLAYGDSGFGPIPGGATLVFAIELLSIE